MFSVFENEKKQFIDLLSLQMGKHATSKGSSFVEESSVVVYVR